MLSTIHLSHCMENLDYHVTNGNRCTDSDDDDALVIQANDVRIKHQITYTCIIYGRVKTLKLKKLSKSLSNNRTLCADPSYGVYDVHLGGSFRSP